MTNAKVKWREIIVHCEMCLFLWTFCLFWSPSKQAKNVSGDIPILLCSVTVQEMSVTWKRGYVSSFHRFGTRALAILVSLMHQHSQVTLPVWWHDTSTISMWSFIGQQHNGGTEGKGELQTTANNIEKRCQVESYAALGAYHPTDVNRHKCTWFCIGMDPIHSAGRLKEHLATHKDFSPQKVFPIKIQHRPNHETVWFSAMQGAFVYCYIGHRPIGRCSENHVLSSWACGCAICPIWVQWSSSLVQFKCPQSI